MRRKKVNPRLYMEYTPVPNRTLSTPRVWRERILDVRYATCLTISEFALLSGIPGENIRHAEHDRSLVRYPLYRPNLATIMGIRRMEAIFREELIQFLLKPYRNLIARENKLRRLDLYGGYTAQLLYNPKWREYHRTVYFEGRTFEDIAQMADVEAIRDLKRIKTSPCDAVRLGFDQIPRPERGAYGRIISAASRGDFMSLDAIQRVMGCDKTEQAGQPADAR